MMAILCNVSKVLHCLEARVFPNVQQELTLVHAEPLAAWMFANRKMAKSLAVQMTKVYEAFTATRGSCTLPPGNPIGPIQRASLREFSTFHPRLGANYQVTIMFHLESIVN